MSTLKLYSLPSFPAGPLPEEPLADDMSLLADDMSQGLVISSGGLGAVQGLTFTVTPYSETEIDVTFRATAISMNDMDIMDKFMQNALTASKYNSYKTSAEASASGSWSLFGGPTAEASAKVTHDAMSGYGLSEAQQKEVLQLVAGFFPKPSTFKFKTTIKNTSPNALIERPVLHLRVHGRHHGRSTPGVAVDGRRPGGPDDWRRKHSHEQQDVYLGVRDRASRVMVHRV